MQTNRFYILASTALLLLLGYLTYGILQPFLAPLAWAIVISIVFYPVYAYILRYLKWPVAASLAVLLLITIVLIGPFSYTFYLLIDEARSLSESFDRGQLESVKNVLNHPTINKVTRNIGRIFNLSLADVQMQKQLTESLSKVGKTIISMIPTGIGNVMSALVNFVFMMFAVFFILKDGSSFMKKLRDYLPFSEENKNTLTVQVKDVVVSTIYGGVVVAIVQGIIGGITYALLGTHSPVLWGLATAISSFIPLVGTFAVWGVIAAYFFIQGTIWKGVVMIVVGVLGISMVDNVLKPIIIGSKTKMHILVIFFSVLGGINFFGLIGLIMGPLVVAVFISVLKIFKDIESGQSSLTEKS
ncbi:MAG: AI-2E family transporter [Nitrospirae bacterium]|nr:AI-2E family transporter [Nitrospirota bacterium]